MNNTFIVSIAYKCVGEYEPEEDVKYGANKVLYTHEVLYTQKSSSFIQAIKTAEKRHFRTYGRRKEITEIKAYKVQRR